MKFRTFGRHVKESFRSIARNGWMTFASVSAVTVTLLLVGVFVVIMMNLNKLADDLENDVEMKVFVELTAEDQQITELEQQIADTLGVKEVVYSTKEDELVKLAQDFGNDLQLFEQDNPLHDVFYVKAATPTETAAVATRIERLDQVSRVEFGKGKIERLFAVLDVSRNVGLVLILGLLFTAMFLISNTIRITIVARRRDIEIMKLVGATNWFIRIPFVFEGMWLGIMGALLPMTLVTTAYYAIYNELQPRLAQSELITLLPPMPFLLQVNGLILVMGIMIGIWGSFMSVRKFLKV
ncbi:cell division transport system permease protein [Chryseomicrobium aureum]|uniref:permease-like cell division protein FtsX n=1 Tax=Chryseomicrobium aureum TaxID=1441723 RepID=UPI00195E76B0|nr:permease-like cell division protein FtsX [Chryseomicrobium aureum]MBM7705193.1 cell division transport system permease protein [Chryseomicrobium aureum]